MYHMTPLKIKCIKNKLVFYHNCIFNYQFLECSQTDLLTPKMRFLKLWEEPENWQIKNIYFSLERSQCCYFNNLHWKRRDCNTDGSTPRWLPSIANTIFDHTWQGSGWAYPGLSWFYYFEQQAGRKWPWTHLFEVELSEWLQPSLKNQ